MKITMLGTSGSGKTVYMSAMSRLFYNKPFEGYRIANREDSYSGNSFVYRGFTEINDLYKYGVFPEGTTSSVVMPLELRYKGDHLIDIDWIDYRGGAIEELAKGVETPQNAEILAALLASDVVMVFVDAVVLKDAKSSITAGIRVGADEISQILNLAYRKKKFDVVFLLTKSDADTINLSIDLPFLTARVGEIYDTFFSENKTSIGQYYVIPVGACGRGNVKCEKIVKTNSRGGKETQFKHTVLVEADELKPFHIAASFARALLLCLERESKNLNTSANQLAKELETLKANFGLVRNLIDILFFGSKRRGRINDLERSISESRNEIKVLEPHSAILERIAKGSQ